MTGTPPRPARQTAPDSPFFVLSDGHGGRRRTDAPARAAGAGVDLTGRPGHRHVGGGAPRSQLAAAASSSWQRCAAATAAADMLQTGSALVGVQRRRQRVEPANGFHVVVAERRRRRRQKHVAELAAAAGHLSGHVTAAPGPPHGAGPRRASVKAAAAASRDLAAAGSDGGGRFAEELRGQVDELVADDARGDVEQAGGRRRRPVLPGAGGGGVCGEQQVLVGVQATAERHGARVRTRGAARLALGQLQRLTAAAAAAISTTTQRLQRLHTAAHRQTDTSRQLYVMLPSLGWIETTQLSATSTTPCGELCAPTLAFNHLLPPAGNCVSLRTRGHS